MTTLRPACPSGTPLADRARGWGECLRLGGPLPSFGGPLPSSLLGPSASRAFGPCRTALGSVPGLGVLRSALPPFALCFLLCCPVPAAWAPVPVSPLSGGPFVRRRGVLVVPLVFSFWVFRPGFGKPSKLRFAALAVPYLRRDRKQTTTQVRVQNYKKCRADLHSIFVIKKSCDLH